MVSHPRFELVKDSPTIERLAKALKAELKTGTDVYPNRHVGSRGGADPYNLRYRPAEDFWFYWHDNNVDHAWIPFGLGAPENSTVSILAENNFNWEGSARGVGAAFGRRGAKYFYLSRGKLAGGRKGIGKNAFWRESKGFKGLVEGELYDSSRSSKWASEKVFILGEIGRGEIARNLVPYLNAVKRFKDKATGKKSIDTRDVASETEQTLIAGNLASASAIEGHPSLFQHLRRERDPKLRRLALKELLRKGPAVCSACDYSFDKVYGAAIGKGLGVVFHHVLPLSAGSRKTKVSDLAPLCPNCHWAVHSKRPNPLAIKELRLALAKAKAVSVRQG